jgi:glycolate oxidase
MHAMTDLPATHEESSAAARQSLVAALRAFLPDAAILHAAEDTRPYECDGLSAYRQVPWLVVLPGTVEQVQQVMRLCHSRGIPVVARGAGTGLSGGALPHAQGVLLSLAKFTSILGIDPANRTARVQPGVRNLAISQAAAAHGLYYAPDPSSQIACTIGGNVAENAGGVHCLKYGLTVHNILRLEVVTVDGERITIGSDALDAPGYDLLALMTGSEGMLGIIVEVSVKLLPIPEGAQVILAAFNDVAKAGAAVGAIISAGIIPAGLEMMDRLAIRAAEDFVHAGYPTDAEAILLCEVDGTRAEVSEHVVQIQELMRHCGATEVRAARDEQERMTFWKGRKAAFPAVGRLSPDYYCMDGTIPRKRLPEVLLRMRTLSEEYGLSVANVFHAGDGNLHPLILYDANKPGELQRTEEFGGRILELCVEVGGTITGEHGVGMEKINQMCVQFSTAELQQFHGVKHAFDPLGLLNPGKAVPTLHRCAEFGAQHVHHNELPFPGLERF